MGLNSTVRHTPCAFSVFSFLKSEKKVLVVDLQGSRSDSYTDPQVYVRRTIDDDDCGEFLDHGGYHLQTMGVDSNFDMWATCFVTQAHCSGVLL